MDRALPDAIGPALREGRIVPYLGPEMLGLCPAGGNLPASAVDLAAGLAAGLTAKFKVPHKIRLQPSAVAQFIENFKHRKSLVARMQELFAGPVVPSPLHAWLASLPLPLVVADWYDATFAGALADRQDWGRVQGLSQSEHFGAWYGYYDAAGSACDADVAGRWTTLVYQPLGCVAPAANFLVSDSDFVEVLTEIDIQTPIPLRVQALRRDRGFLFLGCRFQDQRQRSFARQIMKRSGGRHWAVLPGELTRNEARFLDEQRIERVDMPLDVFASRLLDGTALLAA